MAVVYCPMAKQRKIQYNKRRIMRQVEGYSEMFEGKSIFYGVLCIILMVCILFAFSSLIVWFMVFILGSVLFCLVIMSIIELCTWFTEEKTPIKTLMELIETSIRYRLLPMMAKKLHMTDDRLEKIQKLLDRCIAIVSVMTKKIKDMYITVKSVDEFNSIIRSFRLLFRRALLLLGRALFYLLIFWSLGAGLGVFDGEAVIHVFPNKEKKETAVLEKTQSGDAFMNENWEETTNPKTVQLDKSAVKNAKKGSDAFPNEEKKEIAVLEKTQSGDDFMNENWGKTTNPKTVQLDKSAVKNVKKGSDAFPNKEKKETAILEKTQSGDDFLNENWGETTNPKTVQLDKSAVKNVKNGDVIGYHIGQETGENSATGKAIFKATIRFIRVHPVLFTAVTTLLCLISWVVCNLILALRRKIQEKRIMKQAVDDNFERLLEMVREFDGDKIDSYKYYEKWCIFSQETIDKLWGDPKLTEQTDFIYRYFKERYKNECYKVYQHDKIGSIQPLISEEADYTNFVASLLERSMVDVEFISDKRIKIDLTVTYRCIRMDVCCRFALSPVGKEEVLRVVGDRRYRMACVFSNNSFTEEARELAKSANVLLFTGTDGAELSLAIQSMKDGMQRDWQKI